MNDSHSYLQLWDYDERCPKVKEGHKLLLWRGFSEQKDIISIPKIVEDFSDTLRDEYLEWIYQVGKKTHNNNSIIKFLKIRDSFSAWWLSLIVEKSNFEKSTYLNDVIKILAFEKFFKNKYINGLHIYTSNKKLTKIFSEYCEKKGINFKKTDLRSKKQKKFKNILKKIFFFCPYEIRAFIWLFYRVFNNLPLVNVGLNKLRKFQSKFLFVSYLFNMKNSDINRFNFSPYWGNLPENLKIDRKTSIWIHIFVKDKFINNTSQAANLIKNLNKNNSWQCHLTL